MGLRNKVAKIQGDFDFDPTLPYLRSLAARLAPPESPTSSGFTSTPLGNRAARPDVQAANQIGLVVGWKNRPNLTDHFGSSGSGVGPRFPGL